MLPLHLGKIAALIAILTITAFVLWLAFGAWFTGDTADQHPAGQSWLEMPLPGADQSAGASQQEQRIGTQAA